jgi:hypothetical protein
MAAEKERKACRRAHGDRAPVDEPKAADQLFPGSSQADFRLHCAFGQEADDDGTYVAFSLDPGLNFG